MQRHLRSAITLCCAWLVACSPTGTPPEAASFEAGPPELEQIERTGIANPAAAAEKAKTLYAQAAPGSFTALNILSVRGGMLAEARDDAGRGIL